MKNQSKEEIRKYIRGIKRNMTQQDIESLSDIIQNRVMQLREYIDSENVYVYVAHNQEVMTDKIINESLAKGKKVFVPKVYGNIMKFHQIQSMSELVLGAYGILEPITDMLDDTKNGIIIIPGVAFDREFHRIGYGGGYYDKYLSLPNSHFKAAICYERQILDDLCYEEYDIKTDVIISEKTYIRR